mmetsp:Transcript_11823/g.34517  ORF Transcript_11823/g.34517 Transcript_11823/m.34517 type:complete len:128 (+) Transcript_11823:77-460(+)
MSGPLYGQDLDTLTEVQVDIGGGKREFVSLDPTWGPVKNNMDGGWQFTDYGTRNDMGASFARDGCHMGTARKPWRGMTSTEQEITLVLVAKQNARTRERQAEIRAQEQKDQNAHFAKVADAPKLFGS